MPALAALHAVDAVYLHPDDNICVAARTLAAGESLEIAGVKFALEQPVRMGHKIAVRKIAKGEFVRKYGQIIGQATESVSPGGWVHSHNLINGEFVRDHAPSSAVPPPAAPIEGRTFQAYRRANGQAGTRNYVAVISTVNCSATVSKYIAQRFDREALKQFPNIDGVIAIKHGGGCGIQYQGLQHEILNRTLAGMAKHANIGGYLLVGLGCEQATSGYLMQSQNLVQIENVAGTLRVPSSGNQRSTASDGTRSVPATMPPVLSMQDEGGSVKTIEAGVRLLGELLPRANDVKRVPIPASELLLGTNCGGSDGNSGVTCNPALGVASDMLVACGGTSALAETTEVYGAEHLLTRRAVNPSVAEKLLDRIKWWLWHTALYGVEIDNTTSIGKKEVGVTTRDE